MIPKKPRFNYSRSKAKKFLLNNTSFTSFPVDPFQVYRDQGWLLFTWSEAKSILGSNDPLKLKKTGAEARTSITRGGNIYITVYDDTIVPKSRVRWTATHEIGHIVLNHLIEYEKTAINRGGLFKEEYKVLEVEADTFAAEVLTPFAVLKESGITSAHNIKKICDVSSKASYYRETTFKKVKKEFDISDRRLVSKYKSFIHEVLHG
ncbi:ImmA/IrrE family metallo-endopeptidase [Halobacillus seohaensis]|uniref:ImmA/IrrE family metallo-endopeptidase n=1 Tax=Halobacillus seohaensis TaxID=447421 RepID=A0ABW2EI93_9BACI